MTGKDILINIENLKSFKTLKREWNTLLLDKYLRKIDGLRYRRFKRVLLNPKNMQIKTLSSPIFYQSKITNIKYGGINRKFGSINKRTLGNKFLKNLITFNFNNLPLTRKQLNYSWEIGIHLIRIIARAKNEGKPSPEGVHKDGHEFISIHLIKRDNARGGVTEIFDKDNNLVIQKLLKSQLDSVYINDKKMLHYVSAFSPINKKRSSIRDVLIMDFSKYKELRNL